MENNRKRFVNKVILVTGAGTGIGAAIAKSFASEGAKVVVAEIDLKSGQKIVEEIHNSGGTAYFTHVDVSKEQNIKDTMQWITENLGGLDVLVNNAAAFVFGTVEQTTEEDWDKILSVNIKGYAFAAKHSAPLLRVRGKGAIVNIASISSFIAQPEFVPYNATKGAILQMSKCMACDLAKDNIRVNCVCPGPIETQATIKHAEKLGKSKQQIVDEMNSHMLIHRMGKPEEVAHAVLFLASDEASFITGTHLVVDGGYLAI